MFPLIFASAGTGFTSCTASLVYLAFSAIF
jgi:hypothetical protein